MMDPTIQALIAAAEAGASGHTGAHVPPDHEPDRSGLADAKLRDAEVAGFEPEFSPQEADAAGAFVEDALGESDAREVDQAWPRFLAALLSPKA
jgi:hypothetical protein